MLESSFASFLRLGEGWSGVAGEECVDVEDAAARCMNFIVRRREDIAFGAGDVADMVNGIRYLSRNIMEK